MAAKVGLWEHFRKLASFEGREDRASFWPYAALVLGIVMLSGFAMMLPMMARSMQAVQQYAAASPSEAAFDFTVKDPSATAQGGAAGVMPSPEFLAAYLALTIGLAILLYAAAVVRRLHDRGKSGAWALMPLPFILYSSIQMPRLFDLAIQGDQPEFRMFLSLAISNMLYLVALATLIVLLSGAGDLEANRYGPARNDVRR